MTNLEIQVPWDNDAGVWIATSEDIPGLCVQADTFDELIDISNQFSPEMLLLSPVSYTHLTLPTSDLV